MAEAGQQTQCSRRQHSLAVSTEQLRHSLDSQRPLDCISSCLPVGSKSVSNHCFDAVAKPQDVPPRHVHWEHRRTQFAPFNWNVTRRMRSASHLMQLSIDRSGSLRWPSRPCDPRRQGIPSPMIWLGGSGPISPYTYSVARPGL